MTRNECARWLLAHDNYCILTHSKPDGDTLGSAATLCLGLRAAGKTAVILNNPEIGPQLEYVCRDLTVPAPGEDATFISVDVAASHLLPEDHKQYVPRIALRIDHHGTATPFTAEELVDPKTGACAEIIYDVLTEMGVALTPEIAIPLYTGVSTDTGCFRYANTTAHSFLTAAACAATGANLQPINQALFDTVSLKRLQLQAWVTEHTRFYADGKLAVCSLPLSVREQLAVNEEDVGGISGFVRSIEGVCMAATLREQNDGRISISLRAVPGYDCAAVCQQFGGGGHKGAAGATAWLPLEEAAEALTNAMLAHLK